MHRMNILDEHIDWSIERAIVVRVQNWANNYLVGDCTGCVVALIPYQSEEGRQNALSIAQQIVTAKTDCNLCITETQEGASQPE